MTTAPPPTVLLRWGFRFGFASLLFVFNEFLFWQSAADYSSVECFFVLGMYAVLAALMLELMVRWHVQRWSNLLIFAGVYGLLQSGLITGFIGFNVPIGIMAFGTGSATLAFVVAFVLLRWLGGSKIIPALLFGGLFVLGLLGGLWTYGTPIKTEVPWEAPTFSTTLLLLGIASGLSWVGVRWIIGISQPATSDWRLWQADAVLMGIFTFVTLLLAIGDRIVWASLVIVVALGSTLALMAWFSGVIEKKSSDWLETGDGLPQPHFLHMAGLWGCLLLGYVIGYGLSETFALAGTLVFLGVAIFGMLWLPVVSTLLGYRAFVMILDQEIN